MEKREVTRPLSTETADQGEHRFHSRYLYELDRDVREAREAMEEFGRSSPDAVTRPQTGEEKQLLLTRSGMGRKRLDGVPVPLMLVQDTISSLAWLASELAVFIHNAPDGGTLDQHWYIRAARDRIVELSRRVCAYELEEGGSHVG